MQTDPRVDAYIAKQAAFAQPILARVRAAMALARPGAVETMKWSHPFWTVGGKPVAMMAAFKAHATLGAWRPMGSTALGREEAGWDRITDIDELPDEATLAAQLDVAIRAAAEAPKVRAERKPVAVGDTPEDVAAALAAANATAQFDAMPPGARREYLDWFAEAKRPETRAKRIAEAAGWIAEGKKRNWKYENC